MTNMDHSEFLEASTIPCGKSDVIDKIAVWVRETAAGIRRVSAELRQFRYTGARAFGGERRFEYFMGQSCRPDTMIKETWVESIALFDKHFVEPLGITVDSDSLIRRALGISTEKRLHEFQESDLELWDAEKVRKAFSARFGDPREESIRQLKELVLKRLGREPANPIKTYCHIHDRCSKGMELTYISEAKNNFTNLVSYLLHLKTGVAPAEIEFPCIFGYSDGARYWDRKELFKKQKFPWEGAVSLRFTADSMMEIELEPELFARFHAAWTEMNSRRNED